MQRNVIAIAIVTMIAVAPASAEEEHSAAWFADHPKERSEVSELCKNYASQAKHNPNCDNAFQGGLIASTRDRDRNTGSSILAAPSVETWRDPKNAELRAFWARQCKIAEEKGRPTEALEGMGCPGIKASGGY